MATRDAETPDSEDHSPPASPADAIWDLPRRVGVEDDVARLRSVIAAWRESAHDELREMLAYQLTARAKMFRPVTMFACWRAATGDDVPEALVRVAAAVELFHNATLVVDDIVDRDRFRRGRLALHCRFGRAPGMATGSYLTFGAASLVAGDEEAARTFLELGRRLAVAESHQWRRRRHAGDISAWRQIASEDTGSMFEACARAALPDGRLDRFGNLLGTLYHGCDDVADVRGSVALGTESDRDVSDRILTLPAAIATRDAATAELYEQAPAEADEELAERLAEALEAAELVLDSIAAEAEAEARAHARSPDALLALVRHTRALSAA